MRAHLEYVISSLNLSPLKHLLRKTISLLLIVALIYPDLAKAMQDDEEEVSPAVIALPLPKDVPLPSRKLSDPVEHKDRAESPTYSPPGNESDLPHSHSSSPERSTGSSGSHDESPRSLGSTPEDPSLNDATNKSSPHRKTPPLLMPDSDSSFASPPSPAERSLLSKVGSVAFPPDEVVLERSDDRMGARNIDSSLSVEIHGRLPEPRPPVPSAFDTLHSLPFIATESSSRSSDLDDPDATAVLPIPAQERHDDDRRNSVLSTSSSPEDVVITGSMHRIPLPVELQRVDTPPARPAASIKQPTERDALLPKGRGSSFRHSRGSIQDADPMEEDRGRPGSKRSSRILSRDELYSEVRVLRDVTGRSDDVEVGIDILERQALLQKVRALNPEDPNDKKTIAFLRYAKDYIIDGKFTWWQIILGGIFGTIIGLGAGNAMPPIFESGLNTIVGNEAFWSPIKAILFTVYVAVTSVGESTPRNVKIIGDLAGPSMEEFSIPGIKKRCWKWGVDLRKGALVLVYIGAGFAALLPVYYLWKVEEKDINFDPSLKTASLTFFGCLAPLLFLDALFSNARAMKNWVDERINARRIHQAYNEGIIFSPARALRHKELSRFDDLIRLFRATPDDDIHDFYEEVLVNGFDIKKNGIDMPDTLKGADTLRTLRALRKIHQETSIPIEKVENWKRKVAKTLGWGIPGAATVGRSLVFYAIIHGLLSSLGANGIANDILSGIFGGAIADLFQGKVEVDAVEAGVYDLLGGEDPESDASHSRVWKGFRKVGKAYSFLQGAWNTLPYILVGIAATQGWPVAVQVITLFFFGVADAFSNTMSFQESGGWVVDGVRKLSSCCCMTSCGCCMTAGKKRHKLINLSLLLKQAYETMDPGVVMRVEGLITDARGPLEGHGAAEIPFMIPSSPAEQSSSDEGF